MVLNGLDSVYETDLLKPVMDEIAKQSKGGLNERAMRIIADHLRTTSFILSEGIKPLMMEGDTYQDALLENVLP